MQPCVRRDLLAALWAFVRAWDKAGRPAPSSSYRGFEEWSGTMGGIVEHAGFGDALKPMAEEVDPDYADMVALMTRLAAGVRSRAEFQFDELIAACRELNAFEWHIQGRTIDERFELTSKARSYFGNFCRCVGADRSSSWRMAGACASDIGARTEAPLYRPNCTLNCHFYKVGYLPMPPILFSVRPMPGLNGMQVTPFLFSVIPGLGKHRSLRKRSKNVSNSRRNFTFCSATYAMSLPPPPVRNLFKPRPFETVKVSLSQFARGASKCFSSL